MNQTFKLKIRVITILNSHIRQLLALSLIEFQTCTVQQLSLQLCIQVHIIN